MTKPLYVAYSTRNLLADYRDRLRVLAAIRRQSIEQVMNDALEIGIAKLEHDMAHEGTKHVKVMNDHVT